MNPTRPKRFRRISIVLLALFGFFALRQGVVFLMPPPEYQQVRLVDGSLVELLGYSYGKRHELHARKPIANLRDLLTIGRPSPVIHAAETDRDTLLLWVRVPQHLDLHPGMSAPLIAYAKGANGYCYPSSYANYIEVKPLVGDAYGTFLPTVGGVLTTEEVLAIPVGCYPQRDKRFEVDLIQYGGKRPLATFQVANANTARPAPFKAESLPVTHRTPDLNVTVDSIKPNLYHEFVLPDGGNTWASAENEPKEGVPIAGNEGRQWLTLAYTYQGKADADWKIAELETSDAMGNRTQATAASPTWPCRSYFPPSVGEPYKLKVGVQKNWNNHFDADELWTVQDISLPTHGKPVAIQGEFRRDDLHLQLVSVYGMDGKNFNADMAIVRIKVEASVANPVLLVHVEDEQGRTIHSPWTWTKSLFSTKYVGVERGNLVQAHTGFISDNDSHYRTIPVKIPKGVRHLKLMFTLPRTHFFEFVAPAYRHASK